MIEPLQYYNAITVTREIPTEGHSPLEVIADDYNLYFIKSVGPQEPPFHLINEFLCSYFLNCWDIPTPKFAAINLDPKLIPDSFSKKYKKHYYKKVCFGSQALKDAIDQNEFFDADKKPDYKKFCNPEILFKIALFDIWVENDDRKPTNNNILLQPDNDAFRIFAIDHAFTFSSMNYENLNPDFVGSSYNDSILLSPLGQSVTGYADINKSWIQAAQENFYLCIGNCEQNYIDIAAQIPEPLGFDLRLQNKLADFLFNEKRNKAVFNEFVSRIN